MAYRITFDDGSVVQIHTPAPPTEAQIAAVWADLQDRKASQGALGQGPEPVPKAAPAETPITSMWTPPQGSPTGLPPIPPAGPAPAPDVGVSMAGRYQAPAAPALAMRTMFSRPTDKPDVSPMLRPVITGQRIEKYFEGVRTVGDLLQLAARKAGLAPQVQVTGRDSGFTADVPDIRPAPSIEGVVDMPDLNVNLTVPIPEGKAERAAFIRDKLLPALKQSYVGDPGQRSLIGGLGAILKDLETGPSIREVTEVDRLYMNKGSRRITLDEARRWYENKVVGPVVAESRYAKMDLFQKGAHHLSTLIRGGLEAFLGPGLATSQREEGVREPVNTLDRLVHGTGHALSFLAISAKPMSVVGNLVRNAFVRAGSHATRGLSGPAVKAIQTAANWAGHFARWQAEFGVMGAFGQIMQMRDNAADPNYWKGLTWEQIYQQMGINAKDAGLFGIINLFKITGHPRIAWALRYVAANVASGDMMIPKGIMAAITSGDLSKIADLIHPLVFNAFLTRRAVSPGELSRWNADFRKATGMFDKLYYFKELPGQATVELTKGLIELRSELLRSTNNPGRRRLVEAALPDLRDTTGLIMRQGKPFESGRSASVGRKVLQTRHNLETEIVPVEGGYALLPTGFIGRGPGPKERAKYGLVEDRPAWVGTWEAMTRGENVARPELDGYLAQLKRIEAAAPKSAEARTLLDRLTRTPVRAPDGGVDFSRIIPKELTYPAGSKLRFFDAPVRMFVGREEGGGLAHAIMNHAGDVGKSTVRDFAAFVVKNFTEIRQGEKGSFILAVRNGLPKPAYIQLTPDPSGNFYRITNAHATRPGWLDNKQLLATRSVPASPDTGSPAPLPPRSPSPGSPPGASRPPGNARGPSTSSIDPQGAAVKPARDAGSRVKVVGGRWNITPEGQGKVRASFGLMEARDLLPSHDPLNDFRSNVDAGYPSDAKGSIQQRRYRENATRRAQLETERIEPQIINSASSGPAEGPPIVLPNGVVLSGNSRAMRLLIHYAREGGDKYRRHLIDNAEMFGLKPSDVEKMNQPVLVRVLPKHMTDTRQLRGLVDVFNKSPVNALDAPEAAVSMADRVAQPTIDWLSNQMESRNAVTVRDLLGKNPKIDTDLFNRLVKDGAVGQTDMNRYLTREGFLTPEGKNAVENMLLGVAVPDADLIATLPNAVKGKITRALGPITMIKGRGGQWADILSSVRDAAGLVRDALNEHQTIDSFMAQGNLIGVAEGGLRKSYSPLTIEIARLLHNRTTDGRNAQKQTAFSGAMKIYAERMRSAAAGQKTMFGKPTPGSAIIEVFGVDPVGLGQVKSAALSPARAITAKTSRLAAQADMLDPSTGKLDFREPESNPGIPSGAKDHVSLNQVIYDAAKSLGITAEKAYFGRSRQGIYWFVKEFLQYRRNQAFFHEMGHWAHRNPILARSLGITASDLVRFVHELKPIASPGNKLYEGFSEFLRYWFTEPEKALKRAPQFLEHWEGKLAEAGNADIAAELINLRGRVLDFFNQQDYSKIAGMIGPVKPFEAQGWQGINRAIGESARDLHFLLVNREHFILRSEAQHIKALAKMLGREAPDLPPSARYGLSAELMRGTGSKIDMLLDRGLIDDPMRPDRPIVYDRKAFEQGGQLKPGSNMPLRPAEILYQIKRVAKKTGENEALTRERFWVYILARRAGWYEAEKGKRLFGLDFPEGAAKRVADQIERMYPDFIQVGKIWDATWNALLRYKWKAGLVSDALYRRLRDEYPFYAPFHRYLDKIIEAHNALPSGRRGGLNIPETIKSLAGSERQIKEPFTSLIERIYETYHVADRNFFYNRLANVADRLPGTWLEVASERQGDVSFFRRGQRVHYKLLDENLLKSLLQFNAGSQRQLIGSVAELERKITRALATPGRMLRAGVVRDPRHWAWNFLRDSLVAAVRSEYGFLPIPFVRGLRALGDVMTNSKVFQDLIRTGMGGSTEAGYNQEVFNRSIEKLNQRVKANGGTVVTSPGQLAWLTIKSLARGRFWTATKQAWELNEILSQAFEYATRVGEAKAALKHHMKSGMPYHEALRMAAGAGRRVTLDFQEKGALALVRQLSHQTPFMTSSIQGKAKFFDAFFVGDKKKLARNWTRLITWTAMAELLHFATFGNDPRYQQREEWEKDNYYLIWLPGQVEPLRYPKSWEFNILGNFVRRALGIAFGQNREGFGQFLSAFLNSLDVRLDALIPYWLKVGSEMALDRTYFSGRSPAPRKMGLNYEQGNYYTTPTDKAVAKVLGAFGLPIKAGWVTYIWKQVGGNLGDLARVALDCIARGAGIVDEKSAPSSSFIQYALRRFVSPQTTYAQATNWLFTDYDRIKAAQDQANDWHDRGLPQAEIERRINSELLRRGGQRLVDAWNGRHKKGGIYEARNVVAKLSAELHRINNDRNLSREDKKAYGQYLIYYIVNYSGKVYGLKPMPVPEGAKQPEDLIVKGGALAPPKRPPGPWTKTGERKRGNLPDNRKNIRPNLRGEINRMFWE